MSIINNSVNSVNPALTRTERRLGTKAERIENSIAKLRAEMPAIPKATAQEVAETLVELRFDEIMALTEDTLLRINGVGTKRAEIILANRWALAGRLVKADEYEIEAVKEAPRQTQALISFNPIWNPNMNRTDLVFRKDVQRGRSVLDEKLIEKGYEPYDVLITVCGYIVQHPAKPTTRETEQLAMWHKWTHAGFRARGGKLFRPLFHGTNAGRKDMVVFVREDVRELVFGFITCEAGYAGVTTEAKFAAYMGLNYPGTIALSDVIGLNVQPEAVALVPSYNKKFDGEHVDFVDVETGTVSIDVVRSVIENMFDGQAYFNISDKKLEQMLKGKSREEKRQIVRKIRQAKSHTGRTAWFKGLELTQVNFHGVLRKLGVRKIKTVDGRVMDIDDIVILGDETVFKASLGENGQYKTWQDYCDAFRRQGHSFRVLIQEHADRPHTLPFQQLQSLIGTNSEDRDEMINTEINYLTKFTDPKTATKLIGGEMANIVRACPGLLAHPWVNTRMQQAYSKLRNQARGGVNHAITHNCFCAKDPIAHMQWIAWAASDLSEELQKKFPKETDYVKGAIEAHTIVWAGKEEGEEAVLSRNPSTDAQAQCVVKVKRDFGEWAEFIRWSTVCYLSVNSYEATRFRGDQDGDHLCLCFKKYIVNMAKAANKFTGGRLIDWVAPSTKKHEISECSMQEYFYGLTQVSPLGQWCDKLTSLVGYGTKAYNHEVACWLVMAVNVFVDASKHGMSTVNIPKFVTEFLSLRDENGELLRDEHDRAVLRPMPVYAMQAKDNAHPNRPGEKKVGSKRCAAFESAGNGDVMRARVGTNVPAVLNVSLPTNENGEPIKFNVSELLYDYNGKRNGGNSYGLRGCEELFARGEYNAQTGKYEGQGLWKEIVYERAHSLRELRDEFEAINDDRFAYNAAKKNIDQFRRYAGLKRLDDWAADHGKTLEDVVDAITFYTFVKVPYPVVRSGETKEAFEKRLQQYNIQFEGWQKICGGMVLRAILFRNAEMKLGIDDDFDPDEEIDDSFIEDLA